MTGTTTTEFSPGNVGPINWRIIARRIAWPRAIRQSSPCLVSLAWLFLKASHWASYSLKKINHNVILLDMWSNKFRIQSYLSHFTQIIEAQKKRKNIAHCVLHKKNKSETRPGQLFPILCCLPKKRTNVY